MMNTKIDMEDILKHLPAEKIGEDFTTRLMSKIAVLPIPQRRRLSIAAIVYISIGALGLMGSAWWITDYFFEWTQMYVQPILQNITETFNGMLPKISPIEYSPIVIGGFSAGAILLLIDAIIRRKIAPQTRSIP